MSACCVCPRGGRCGFFILMVLCLALPAVVRGDFSFANFSSTAGLNLQGRAAQSGTVLRLTPASQGPPGSAWFATLQGVGGGFTTTFQFQIDNFAGCAADGFAFVVQNSSGTALGGGGGGIGYDGIPNSLAVEFDTFQNATDPNANHVSVHTLGTSPNSSSETASIGNTGTSLAVNLKDGSVHNARVTYTAGAPGSMAVFIDNFTTPVLTVSVNLAGTLSLTSGAAFVGFTAGTGACVESHDILSWSFTGTGGGCPAHAHGHVSSGSPGHFGNLSNPHAHHAQHGTHLVPNTCPPHAFGHQPLLPQPEDQLAGVSAAASPPDFVAALNQDGAAEPAARGTVLQLFGSAEGLYLDEQDTQSATEFTPPASGSPLYYTTSLPEVLLDAAQTKVLFSGLAPGLRGVWQINVLVPEQLRAGKLPVVVFYEGQLLRSVDVEVR